MIIAIIIWRDCHVFCLLCVSWCCHLDRCCCSCLVGWGEGPCLSVVVHWECFFCTEGSTQEHFSCSMNSYVERNCQQKKVVHWNFINVVKMSLWDWLFKCLPSNPQPCRQCLKWELLSFWPGRNTSGHDFSPGNNFLLAPACLLCPMCVIQPLTDFRKQCFSMYPQGGLMSLGHCRHQQYCTTLHNIANVSTMSHNLYHFLNKLPQFN